MRKIWAVIRREFVERIRTRWFWIMALLGPLFFAAVFVLPTVLAGGGGIRQIVVVDATTGSVGARITQLLNDSRVFRAVRVSAGGEVVDSLTAEVEQKRLGGFLILTDAAVDSGKAEYRGSNVSGFATVGALQRTIGEVVSAVRLEREGVDPRIVARARIAVRLETKKIAGGKTTGETAAQSFSLAYFMGIILYTAILLYGINVMSSVLEEKTTRIVEVLVSSLRPFQLMLGKVLGVGAVSILQFLIWGVSARILLANRPGFLTAGDLGEPDPVFQVPHVSGATAAVFITYFLGGFFLYSAMFAAVGAMSSSEQEARQAQQPVSWLLVLSFVSMFGMLNDPASAFSVTLSLVPFSAPIAMPVRWAAGNLPTYEIALSLGILAVSIVAVTWIAARIYRVGILMTGKRPNLRELVRWVRA
ncbi:MAG TPA: ABC transporter permease [Gemmatimonadales bacterium]|nr:ABC transporter permease [Gemmatimonadales bacterium]